MNNIAEELRDIADKAEAGEKLHWAKVMRAAALQLENWQRDLETYRLRLDHHDAQSAQLGEALEENKRLKDALFFWLPNIPAEESECADRMANDAALLIGHEGRIDDSAEQRGWIALTPNVELTGAAHKGKD